MSLRARVAVIFAAVAVFPLVIAVVALRPHAGLWTDRELLDRLSLDELREGAAIVSDERVLATRGGEWEPPFGLVRTSQQRGPRLAIATQLSGASAAALLLWTMLDSKQAIVCWLLIAGSALLSGLTGWLVAGRFIAPTRRVLLESERSRDELRQSLSRLGQTLSSSLDLSRTLSVVVETAMSSLAADRAVLMLLTPERDALFAKVGRGLGPAVPRLRAGQGLTGWVAATGSPLRLPADAQHAPAPSADEPVGENQLLVPLFGRGQVIGVLSLLRDEGIRPFLQADLDTMTSFAAQASVAIENVLLHREAQRLAITDPLTGLWNFRHFQVQADREVESAVRFDRPLSLVIVDLDHFKRVNDGLGHQAGDEVLNEVARRIRHSTRVPDVVARYGGEEFVVLLPGTGETGALATAERIRAAVDSAPVKVEMCGEPGVHLPVTCSAGVSSFPVHGKTLEGLLRAADAAMYVAKTRGRNRVVMAGGDALREVPWRGAPAAVND
ncbi:MAG: diguanylate cyclase [Egibacteraceae bacterium]